MKIERRAWRTPLLTATVLAVAGCGSAESAEADDQPVEDRMEETASEAPTVSIPNGTTMSFRVLQELSTNSTSTGAGFGAELTHDVVLDGEVVIPEGTRASGVVTQSRESPGPDDPAVLAVAIESITIDGVVVPVKADVTAAELEAGRRASDGETVAKIAVGTAAGALLGRVIGGDTKDALIGAGAGAVAGTAVAIHTQDGHAEIPQGSILTVKLAEPVAIDR